MSESPPTVLGFHTSNEPAQHVVNGYAVHNCVFTDVGNCGLRSDLLLRAFFPRMTSYTERRIIPNQRAEEGIHS